MFVQIHAISPERFLLNTFLHTIKDGGIIQRCIQQKHKLNKTKANEKAKDSLPSNKGVHFKTY